MAAFYRAFDSQADEIKCLIIDTANRLELIETLFGVADPALRLHLLCTCIDALSDPRWLGFHDWLTTKKEKYGTEAHAAALADAVRSLHDNASPADMARAIQHVHRTCLDEHGIGKRFGQFFRELPDAAKHLLVNSYLVLRPPRHYVNQKHVDEWLSKSEDVRLESIAWYLFTFRRNRFTHSVKSYPAQDWLREYGNPETALATPIAEPDNWRVLTFWRDRTGPDEPELELYVLVRGLESFLLHLAIACHVRELLGFSNNTGFVELLAQSYASRRLYWNLLQELEANWHTYQFYAIRHLFRETHYGLPRFEQEWLAAALERLPEESTPRSAQWLGAPARRSRLQALNRLIDQFNERYPPIGSLPKEDAMLDKRTYREHRQAARRDLCTSLRLRAQFLQAGRDLKGLVTAVRAELRLTGIP